VASVTPAADQPQAQDKAVMFYEDFDQLPDWRSRFFEYGSEKEGFVWSPNVGLHGGAMRCQFEQGQVSAGSLNVLFGQNPFGRGLRRDESCAGKQSLAAGTTHWVRARQVAQPSFPAVVRPGSQFS
jgi:hypothetical protein